MAGGPSNGGGAATGLKSSSLLPSSSWIRLHKIQSDKSPALRKVQSILNKVSDRNYDTIAQALRACVSTASVSTQQLVDAILDQCVRQACYVKLFVCMLHDLDILLTASSSADDKHAWQNAITCFCDEFFRFDELLAKIVCVESKGGGEYDEYCSQVKIKSRLVGHCKAVMFIIKLGMYTRYTIQDVMTLIIGHACQVATTDGHDTGHDSGHLDVMLDFAIEYKNAIIQEHTPATDADARCAEWMHAMSKDILPHARNSRQRFKIVDVIDALEKRLHV